MLGQSSVLGVKELWKTKAPNNYRFFIWLVLLGRCWMVDRLEHCGIRSDNTCILCYQEIETIDYILVQCVFAREVWFKGLRHFGWHILAPTQEVSYAAWWIATRKRVPKGCRRAFDPLSMIIAWVIWLQRNNRTFNCSSLTVGAIVFHIFEMVQNWILAGIIDRSQVYAM
jgi:hypothetical protein